MTLQVSKISQLGAKEISNLNDNSLKSKANVQDFSSSYNDTIVGVPSLNNESEDLALSNNENLDTTNADISITIDIDSIIITSLKQESINKTNSNKTTSNSSESSYNSSENSGRTVTESSDDQSIIFSIISNTLTNQFNIGVTGKTDYTTMTSQSSDQDGQIQSSPIISDGALISTSDGKITTNLPDDVTSGNSDSTDSNSLIFDALLVDDILQKEVDQKSNKNDKLTSNNQSKLNDKTNASNISFDSDKSQIKANISESNAKSVNQQINNPSSDLLNTSKISANTDYKIRIANEQIEYSNNESILNSDKNKSEINNMTQIKNSANSSISYLNGKSNIINILDLSNKVNNKDNISINLYGSQDISNVEKNKNSQLTLNDTIISDSKNNFEPIAKEALINSVRSDSSIAISRDNGISINIGFEDLIQSEEMNPSISDHIMNSNLNLNITDNSAANDVFRNIFAQNSSILDTIFKIANADDSANSVSSLKETNVDNTNTVADDKKITNESEPAKGNSAAEKAASSEVKISKDIITSISKETNVGNTSTVADDKKITNESEPAKGNSVAEKTASSEVKISKDIITSISKETNVGNTSTVADDKKITNESEPAKGNSAAEKTASSEVKISKDIITSISKETNAVNTSTVADDKKITNESEPAKGNSAAEKAASSEVKISKDIITSISKETNVGNTSTVADDEKTTKASEPAKGNSAAEKTASSEVKISKDIKTIQSQTNKPARSVTTSKPATTESNNTAMVGTSESNSAGKVADIIEESKKAINESATSALNNVSGNLYDQKFKEEAKVASYTSYSSIRENIDPLKNNIDPKRDNNEQSGNKANNNQSGSEQSQSQTNKNNAENSAIFSTIKNEISSQAKAVASKKISTAENFSVQRRIPIGEFASAVVNIFKENPASENHSAQLTLNPSSLGTVIVNIRINGSNADIVFRAESTEAAKQIENQIPILKEKLSQQGIKADNIFTEVKKDEQQMTNEQQLSQQRQGNQKDDRQTRQEFLSSFSVDGNNAAKNSENKEEVSPVQEEGIQGRILERYV